MQIGIIIYPQSNGKSSPARSGNAIPGRLAFRVDQSGPRDPERRAWPSALYTAPPGRKSLLYSDKRSTLKCAGRTAPVNPEGNRTDLFLVRASVKCG